MHRVAPRLGSKPGPVTKTPDVRSGSTAARQVHLAGTHLAGSENLRSLGFRQAAASSWVQWFRSIQFDHLPALRDRTDRISALRDS